MCLSSRLYGGSLLVLSLFAGIPATAAPVVVPLRPVVAQEAASRSVLTKIPLTGAYRIADAEQLAPIRQQIDAMMKEAGGKRGADELLLWTKPTYTGADSAAIIRNSVAEQMKKAEYSYQTQEKDGVHIVVAGREAKNELYIGLWMKTEEALLLYWAKVEKESKESSTPTSAPAAGTSAATTTNNSANNSAVLVSGNPALTRQMVDQTCHFLAFLLEAPLTEEQKARLEKEIVAGWKKKDKDTVEGIQQLIGLRAQVWAKPEAERDFIRKQIQPEFLKGLRAEKDPMARWMLNIYNTAHRPLAPGNPPLTRQMTDAYAEVLYFMGSEVLGETIPVSAKNKAAFAKSMASSYAKAPAEFKKTLAQMPLMWSAIRVAWPQFPEEKKKALREQWRKDFGAFAAARQAAAPKTTTATSTSSTGNGRTSRSSIVDYGSRMRAMQAQQQMFQSMMNFNQRMHYSRMNTINIGFGNPTRYVNAWGNPY